MTSVLVAIACAAFASGDGPQIVRRDGVTTVSGALGNEKVSIVIEAKERNTKELLGNEGAASTYGKTVLVVRSMRILFGNRTAWVARSSYADLLQVGTVELDVKGDGGQIVMRGGDASTGFEARIAFDRRGVKSRKIIGEEKRVTEETVYMRHVID